MMKAGELPRSKTTSAFPIYRCGSLLTDHIDANEVACLVLDGDGKLHDTSYDGRNPATYSYPRTGVLKKSFAFSLLPSND